jgi:hypothetical protein
MPVFEIVLHQPVLESVTVRVNARTASTAQAKAVAMANDGRYDFSDGEGYGTAYVAGCSELGDDDAVGGVCEIEPSCSDPTEALGRAVENLLGALEESLTSDLGASLRKAFERWKEEAR